MKTTNRFRFLALTIAISVSSIFADTLYLKNGQEIKDAIVTEIGESEVKYKVGGRQVVYTAKKSDIALILYDDGTKDMFDSENEVKSKQKSIEIEYNEEHIQPKKAPEKQAAIEEPKEARFRYGGRVAYNVSSTDDSDNKFGNGFEAGFLASIPISGTYTFNPGINFIYRSPINAHAHVDLGWWYGYVNVAITEYAISIPLLIQNMPFGGPVFYTNGGIQIDVAFNTKIVVDNDYEEKFHDRNLIDFGIACGIGWFIGDHLAIDWKLAVVSLTKFSDEYSDKLIQAALGLSYLL